jgi:type I restriction enzyme S subunit
LRAISPRFDTHVTFAPDDRVWNLTLDQIKSGTGTILNRQEVAFADAGPSTFIFDEDTVLYSKLRPYLNKVTWPRERGVATTELVPLKPGKSTMLPGYLTHYLRSPTFLSYINSRVAGAKMPRVVMDEFWAHEVPHPVSLDEQARIVELLDQADALRRQRAEADAKFARLLPALFRHYFGDPVRNDRGWPTEPLTKICEPRQWPTISQKELTPEGYTVYGANGPIGFYSSYNHEEPTVLITCRGATCGTINVSPPKCYVTGNAMALDNPDPAKTTNEFLEAFLHVRGLNDTITGAAQPQITRANLSVVNVFTPPMPLVLAFSGRLRELNQLRTHAAASAAKLETLFQTLLHRAFTGELTANWREAQLREGVEEIARATRP